MSTYYHELYELAVQLPAVSVLVLTLALAVVLSRLIKPDPLAKLPIVGAGHQEFMQKGAWSSYVDGYNQFKDGAWRITTARVSPGVVISPKFLPELKSLPDDVLSLAASFSESMHARYTGINVEIPEVPHTIKASLNPALARLNPAIAAEVEDAMRLELPQTNDWTEVYINKSLLRIVAIASGRVFVGPELCHNEAYLDASINYTVDFMTAIYKINATPVWLRPIVSRFLPQVRRLHDRIQKSDEFLRPIIESRHKESEDLDFQKPDDMLQWMIDLEKYNNQDDKDHVMNQLALSFAAIHTTTNTITNAIYTLAANPSLAPMLREDVQQALANTKGEFTSLAMQSMEKLDSFMKEIFRFYPLQLGAFQRKVLRSFTLSNGQTIPSGVIVELPQAGVNFDPTIYDSPFEFDALRFYKLRKANEAETGPKASEALANSQFVSVAASSLAFGAGRRACPGRFFAVNEIKMIMSNILLRYDIRNIDGEAERYENLQFGSHKIGYDEEIIGHIYSFGRIMPTSPDRTHGPVVSGTTDSYTPTRRRRRLSAKCLAQTPT